MEQTITDENMAKETRAEIRFNYDFDWLFKGMYANLPSTPVVRESFLNFQRRLRNEVIKKWKPK